MPYPTQKAWRRIQISPDLYIAGRYAGARDVHMAQAAASKPRDRNNEKEVALCARIRKIYAKRAREDHRHYWQAMQRVRLGQVVPLRIPVLQAAR